MVVHYIPFTSRWRGISPAGSLYPQVLKSEDEMALSVYSGFRTAGGTFFLVKLSPMITNIDQRQTSPLLSCHFASPFNLSVQRAIPFFMCRIDAVQINAKRLAGWLLPVLSIRLPGKNWRPRQIALLLTAIFYLPRFPQTVFVQYCQISNQTNFGSLIMPGDWSHMTASLSEHPLKKCTIWSKY